MSLKFLTRVHESYRIEGAADLASPDWITGLNIMGTGATVSEALPPATDKARYYRLECLDQP
ncbi:MAG TPA: hypothetical protein VMF06_20475 [Candidatus Limnocylindria bacterium]|nr:hypothetical protein [Candidatus Limnocylindria bacterium]